VYNAGKGCTVAKQSNMSAAESLFIRTYIVALRRQYSALKSVMHFMHPDNFGLAHFLDAVRITAELDSLQQDFDRRLSVIQQQRKMPYKSPPTNKPSPDELADMVMLSFFKVVGVVHNSHGFLANKSDGWFSGKPNEWQAYLNKLLEKKIGDKEPPPDDLVTKCMQAIANLFYSTGNASKKWKIYPPEWHNKYDQHATHDDDYFDEYDDDEPENLFWE